MIGPTRIELFPLLRALAKSRSGLALTEFALSLPLLMTAGLWGVETAHLAVMNMRISQVAIQVADNGSRIGETSSLENRKIYESDINDLLYGAEIQAGTSTGLYKHGRVIISSLEVVPGTQDQQYIHWQRCKGEKNHPSSYGVQGQGLDGNFPGMGPMGQELTASRNEAVIFVEISYDYQPLISGFFAKDMTIETTSAFTVRSSRDLSQVYQRDVATPDAISGCALSDGDAVILG